MVKRGSVDGSDDGKWQLWVDEENASIWYSGGLLSIW